MLVSFHPPKSSSAYFAMFSYTVSTQVPRSTSRSNVGGIKKRERGRERERKSIIKSKQIELKNFLSGSSICSFIWSVDF